MKMRSHRRTGAGDVGGLGPSISRSPTFTACSRGVFPLESSHARSFPTVSSCAVAGATTATRSRVAGPTIASANPQRRNSAIPRAAASYSDDADTETVCVTPALSVNDTLHALDTINSIGEEMAKVKCSIGTADHSGMTDLERTNAELRAALIIAGQADRETQFWTA
jgi:hypothetical protein